MAYRFSFCLLAATTFALGAAACGSDPPETGTGGKGGTGGAPGTGGAGAAGSGASGGSGGDAAYDWKLPAGYPKPKVPEDNPMTAAKVELGRRLFYDKRLSGNGTFSCASCHEQKLAFTDGLANAKGSTGEIHPRSSMSIVNVAYFTTLTWGNPLLTSLEEQALLPMFGETPVELGLAGQEDELLDRLREEPLYEGLFADAFPEEADPIALIGIVRALASFQRSIISYRSPYDRFVYASDVFALSDSALRGKDLFFGERLECFHCHGGFNLSDSVATEGSTFTEKMFHNTGLYNLDGNGAYPAGNGGVFDVTGLATDMGRFRAPSLRNVALTAPYMHDGSIATLSEALDHYSVGGRTIPSGPNAGIGSKNPYKSELINGFDLSLTEKADVIAFLMTFTDTELLTDPRFSDPWKASD